MKHCFIISVFWFNMDVVLNRLAKGCVSLVNPEECNLLCVGTSGGPGGQVSLTENSGF